MPPLNQLPVPHMRWKNGSEVLFTLWLATICSSTMSFSVPPFMNCCRCQQAGMSVETITRQEFESLHADWLAGDYATPTWTMNMESAETASTLELLRSVLKPSPTNLTIDLQQCDTLASGCAVSRLISIHDRFCTANPYMQSAAERQQRGKCRGRMQKVEWL